MEIGSLTGQISLEDQFSDALSIAAEKVKSFVDEFEGMIGGIAAGAGIAIGAFTAITAAVTALGVEGSHINDVKDGFDRMAGGVQNATAILAAMQKGTSDTVSDLVLMTEANKLLATQSVTTAEGFGTLTTASQVLSREGFGSLDTVMGTLSRSLETGQTRRLAMMGVTVDAKTAEANYAAVLGETASQLTKSEKLIADRQAIMEALTGTVNRAGVIQLSFAQQIDQAKTAISNWVEELASAIASSDTLQVVVSGLKSVFDDVFGGTQEASIKTTVGAINSFLVGVTNVGIAGVITAEVFNTAWSAIKTVVLGVETVIVGIITTIGEVLLAAEKLAGKLHIVDPSEIAAIQATQDGLRSLTAGLAEETEQAALGVVGQNELGRTLDKLGGSLMNTRDAAITAASALDTGRKAAEAFVGPINQIAKSIEPTAAQLATTAKLWDAYYKAVNAASHDTVAAQINDVWLAANAQIAAMEASKNFVVADYDIIWATALKTADNIHQKELESDQYSREHYQKLADVAHTLYERALDDITSHSTKEIQILAAADRAAQQIAMHWVAQASTDIDAANAKLAASVTTNTATATAALDNLGATFGTVGKNSSLAVNSLSEGIMAMNAGFDASKITVRGLSGEVETLTQAIAQFNLGNTQTYDLSTQAGMDTFKKLNPSAQVNADTTYFKTHSLEDAIMAGLVDLYAGFKNLYNGAGLGVATMTQTMTTATSALNTAATATTSMATALINATGALGATTAAVIAAVGGLSTSTSGFGKGDPRIQRPYDPTDPSTWTATQHPGGRPYDPTDPSTWTSSQHPTTTFNPTDPSTWGAGTPLVPGSTASKPFGPASASSPVTAAGSQGNTYITNVTGTFGTVQQVVDAVNAANIKTAGRKF